MYSLWSFLLLGSLWTSFVNCQYTVDYQNATITVTEGDNVTLYCSFRLSGSFQGLRWYKLNPGTSPVHLINAASKKKETEGRLTLDFSDNSCYLHIQHLSVSDSSLYLCAVHDRGSGYKYIFGQGTKLQIIPKTERTDTSVYKLKSRKEDEGLPNSVCLVTDFPSPKKNLKVDGIESSLNVTAVLDKSTNDVWRYSTVVWDNNDDVNCRVQYGDGPEKSPNSGPENAEEACSSLSIDASFRTNPSMNTSSLTVLGLRIVTAKAIIFNLIITLRLWSS